MTRRRRQLFISALNVTAHPHPEGIYEQLLIALLDTEVFVRGSERAMVVSAQKWENSDLFWGSLFIYTELQKDGAWFNQISKGEATLDELKRIEIPDNLKPNLKQMRYVFDTKRHILYFESRNQDRQHFSPYIIGGVFSKLFKAAQHKLRSDIDINVTVLPEKDAVDKIFNIDIIKKIIIRLKTPNPDDVTSDAAKILERLDAIGAGTQDITYTKARDADSLKPDEELKAVAEVASKNGFVKATGRTVDGQWRSASTKEYPAAYGVFIGDAESAVDAILLFAQTRDIG
nr:DUF4747 family protein [Rhodomicrobium sp. Az07]